MILSIFCITGTTSGAESGWPPISTMIHSSGCCIGTNVPTVTVGVDEDVAAPALALVPALAVGRGALADEVDAASALALVPHGRGGSGGGGGGALADEDDAAPALEECLETCPLVISSSSSSTCTCACTCASSSSSCVPKTAVSLGAYKQQIETEIYGVGSMNQNGNGISHAKTWWHLLSPRRSNSISNLDTKGSQRMSK